MGGLDRARWAAAFLLSAAAADIAFLPTRSTATEFSAAPRTCGVLQAAYGAATGLRGLVFPTRVVPETRTIDLETIAPDYRATLALSPAEFATLAAEQHRYEARSFRPACRWKGRPRRAEDQAQHAVSTSFSSPVFTPDRRLAIVEVSVHEAGMFGHGKLCVVRMTRGRWRAECRESWVS